MTSPRPPGLLRLGMPRSFTRTVAPGEVTSPVAGCATTSSPSTPLNVSLNPHSACRSVMAQPYNRSSPSRLNTAWGFSSMTTTRSADLPGCPGCSEPLAANVSFVPAFHPGLTSTSMTSSISLMDTAPFARCASAWASSGVFAVAWMRRVTFSFLQHPANRSSSERASLYSSGAGRLAPPPMPPMPPMPLMPLMPPKGPPMPGKDPPIASSLPNENPPPPSPKTDSKRLLASWAENCRAFGPAPPLPKPLNPPHPGEFCAPGIPASCVGSGGGGPPLRPASPYWS
mmetsp:Transcript_10289/g.40224  ORF Transcript_10289/g.40224 Transcript_10289/m.40224 type:complete len:285 (-) Transcript_10289:380-1234(-)